MRAAKDGVLCPYCGSADTEFLSLFGQQLMTVQYYCNNCRTPFERVKDDTVYEHARLRAQETDEEPSGIRRGE